MTISCRAESGKIFWRWDMAKTIELYPFSDSDGRWLWLLKWWRQLEPPSFLPQIMMMLCWAAWPDPTDCLFFVSSQESRLWKIETVSSLRWSSWNGRKEDEMDRLGLGIRPYYGENLRTRWMGFLKPFSICTRFKICTRWGILSSDLCDHLRRWDKMVGQYFLGPPSPSILSHHTAINTLLELYYFPIKHWFHFN